MLILCQVPHSYNKVPKTYLSIVYINLLGKQVSPLTNSRLNLRLSFALINTLPLTEGHDRLDYSRFSTPYSARL